MKNKNLYCSSILSMPQVAALMPAINRQIDANKLLLPLPMAGSFLTLLLLLFCAADAIMTLRILESGGVELNPAMATLLDHGIQRFIGFKMALTALGSLLLVSIGIERQIFGRWNIGTFLYWAVAFYGLLVTYELIILSTR